MTKRKIININEKKCNGCGECIPNCPEGAIQIIEGKARLISDFFCDGLGACIGHCPQGAITIEEREADIYDEKKVMDNIIKAGEKTILAHLQHLKDHGETGYLSEALEYLEKQGIQIDFPVTSQKTKCHPQGCPGAQMMDFSTDPNPESDQDTSQPSQLRQWPIQLHLVPPTAPYYQGKDVLLVADCVGYSLGDFHNKYLKGKSIAIACPKLDSNQEIYHEKLVSLIDDAQINSLTVMTMQVPCCSGLVHLAQEALNRAQRKIPLKNIIVGIKGEILKDEWI